MAATNHVWLRSTGHVDSTPEEFSFTFYSPVINFNSYLWLVAITLGITILGKGVYMPPATYAQICLWVQECVCA